MPKTKKRKSKESTFGFAPIVLILIVVGILTFSAGAWYLSKIQNQQVNPLAANKFIEPVDSKGKITGKVAVGPICPVERVGVPCPVPSEAYTSRTIIIYKADGKTEVSRFPLNADGTYSYDLGAGTYILDIVHQAVGGSKDLPHVFQITAGRTTNFNFSIDTGIR